MPHLLRNRRQIFGTKKGITYLLRDEFTTDRAAGAVHGTAAEPGPGVRTVVDTESKLSISGDAAVFLGGKVSPAHGDPGMWLPAVTRQAGLVGIWDVTPFNGSGFAVGFDSAVGGTIGAAQETYISGTSITRYSGPIVGSFSSGVNYQFAHALRANGLYQFVRGGTYSNWTLLWVIGTGNTATLYPCLSNFAARVNLLDFSCPLDLWLPVPIVSDGFGSTFGISDGLGHAETTGIGSGGGGVAWTQQVGTWTASSDKAVATALSGGEAVATVPLSTANPMIGIDLARSAGNVGGVARWTDSNNHLRFYHDGTNCVLQQVVSGTPTTLITAAATYSANARVWLWLNDTTARLYYNNALVGSTSSINAGLTATNAGIRTTDTSNTMDNFAAYAVGVEGQYSNLNQY